MTWTRKELKEKGKKAFKKNYWKCVLVAIILTIVTGSASAGSASSEARRGFENAFGAKYEVNLEGYENGSLLTDEQITEIEESLQMTDEEKATFEESIQNKDFDDAIVESLTDQAEETEDAAIVAFVVVMIIVFLVVFTVILAFVILIDVFFLNPIEMGCSRFFYKNLDEDAKVSNVLFAYDNNFKNTAKILFFRDLYTGLWSLLLIIPGIVKSYEYRMIPYLLAENPDMTKEEAFAESKRLMTGNKWKAFVLDLSFLGWIILSLLTCGILAIFYVNPYIFSTYAALYEKLRYGANNEIADVEA